MKKNYTILMIALFINSITSFGQTCTEIVTGGNTNDQNATYSTTINCHGANTQTYVRVLYADIICDNDGGNCFGGESCPTNFAYDIRVTGAQGTVIVASDTCFVQNYNIPSQHLPVTNVTFITKDTDNSSDDVELDLGNIEVGYSITTGIEEQTKIEEFSVYPNPTNGNLFIKGSSEGLTTINLYDISGKLKSKSSYTNKTNYEVEIDGEAGFYLVEILTPNSNEYHRVLKK